MKIFNTMTKKKEEFVPLEEGKVKMYVCGPTVYNFIHIGNARPMIVFDTVRRYFEYKGYDVNYVSNFTDVDDKIIKKAIEEGTTAEEISQRYIKECKKDMHDLNIEPATTHPLATQEIDGMIEMIKTLIDKGYAYEVDGDVYFRVTKVKEYGMLSGIKVEDLIAGASDRTLSEDDKKKESTTDFALWKKTNEGIQFDTPWSKGRPGWHTECVVMINKLFKDGKIDIHGGGQDLKFPHHENEIAQSMAYNGHPIANYWMHNQMINIDGEKMSKSLGNVLWAKDLIVEFGCNVFKWLMLSTHYRNPLNMTDDVIAGVRKEVSKVENATKNASLYLQVNHVLAHDYKKGTVDAMVNALEDDLNTSLALTQVLDQVKVLNQVMRVREKDNDVIATEYATLVKMGDVLGFLFEGTKLSEEDIALYEQWNAYKKEKNFDEADRVRKELTERGIL